MRRVLVVVALAACGRLNFDELGVDAAGTFGAHVAYLKADTTIPGAQFGDRVALAGGGTTLAVGTLNADYTYVYRRTGDTWAQEARLRAGVVGDQFGRSVALSADGATLVVGAALAGSSAGKAYVFTRTGTTWSQAAVLDASNANAGDEFGASAAISADGTVIAIGALFEASAATGIGGNQADNTAMHAGAVYVFTSTSGWAQQAYIKASNTDAFDLFGESVALSNDGTTLAIGAPLESSSATGIDGDQADNSMLEAGAVYVFTGPAWAQQAYVKASNTHLNDPSGSYAQFGWGVALSNTGNVLVVGARGEQSAATGIGGDQADNSASGAGAVYAFMRAGATWSQTTYIKASNTTAGDYFGETVALSHDGTALATTSPNEDGSATGLDGDDDNGALDSGAVYTFAAAPWRQTHYVKQTNTDAGDAVGSVAISGDSSVLAVGAPLEDSAATGIDGDETDNSAIDSGAVYVWY